MILGLTGGIASGKSTASKILKELGAYIIDADEISRKVANSVEVITKIKEKFGKEYIIDKKINRQKMKELVFKIPSKRLELNKIMHPIIVKKIKDEIERNKNKKLIILDIPLLYEAKLEYLCEKVLVIWVDEKTQIDRINKRDDVANELAKKIIDSQMKLSEKLKRSDYNIENSGTLEELSKEIEKLVKKIA